MDKLIIGILVIWGGVWLLGLVLRVLSDIASAVSQQWERTRTRRVRVGYAIGYPTGVVAATIQDHRLMSTGLAISLFVAALFLAGADSASLVSFIDALGAKDLPLLGWAIFGGVAGIAMGVGSRFIELGWFDAAAISRVPDIGHLRAGEEAAARYFRIRRFAAVVGAVILLLALAFSYWRNAGYDPRVEIDRKTAAIAAAGIDGRIAVLNAALEDSAGRLQSDPKSGLKILVALQELSRQGGRLEVERVATIAQKYLVVYREETEKIVTDGKPEALARSEAFSEVDRLASLKWLGRLYEQGKGGANRDLAKAFSLYGEAAGDKTAATMQENLAHIMVSSKDEGARDVVFRYLEQRAQTGGPSDYYWLGEWYARSSKPEDQKNAETWLAKAVTQDMDADIKKLAFTSLAKFKDIGPAAVSVLDEQAPKYAKGKADNMKKAAYTYLEQRANAGDPGAALWMGFRYAEGDGIAKDNMKAREWFLKALLQDKNQAVKNRALEALGERNHAPITGAQPKVVDSAVAANRPRDESDAPKGGIGAVIDGATIVQPQPAPLAPPVSAAPTVTPNATGIPPNASLAYGGRSWSCNSGFVRVSNECIPLQIPPNASLAYGGHSWNCNSGFVRVGNECIPLQIPPNASLAYGGHSWNCNSGFVRVGNECIPLQIPPNASLAYGGHSWNCNSGFVRVSNECVALQIPPNASLAYGGHSWNCNSGFVRVGNECILLQIPPNASLAYGGHSWNCNSGFVRVGNECILLQIPPNASLAYGGHSWNCNKGYVRSGNECVIR